MLSFRRPHSVPLTEPTTTLGPRKPTRSHRVTTDQPRPLDSCERKVAATKDWTVMVYQGNGCYGKFDTHLLDLKELEKIVPSDRVSFVSQGHAEYNEDGLERREIEPYQSWKPCPPIETVPSGRQVDPNQLADFLRWGVEHYPAKHYCLVLSGYAGGPSGMLSHQDNGLMNLPAIREGLEGGLGQSGAKLDVLALDGHWMACAESATEFADTAKYLVASQGRMESWNYEERFGGLSRRSQSSPEDLVGDLVKTDREESAITAYDLEQVPCFLEATRQFCGSMVAQDWSKVGSVRWPGTYHFYELASAAKACEKESYPTPIREDARALSGAIEQLVLYHQPATGSEPTGGISVADLSDARTQSQRFDLATGWGEMLSRVPISRS